MKESKRYMTVSELCEMDWLEVISRGREREVRSVFCCDLLSVAMSRAPAGCAWVTVMANENTLAVASLTNVAMIILAEGVELDEKAKRKAMEYKIAVAASKKPIYEVAKRVDEMIR